MEHYPRVYIKKGRDIPLFAGHPWIFSKALQEEYRLPAGELVAVYSATNEPLGIGMYNPKTSIRVRMLARETAVCIDHDFFIRRFSSLDDDKRPLLPPETTGYRLVHGDADYFPGLIVDRYGEVCVFQIHTAGMDRMRNEIIEALRTAFSPRAIVERSDIEARKREGLGVLPVAVHEGSIDGVVPFTENGLHFFADVVDGQKTGFYLDQRNARMRVAGLVRGKSVLNLFSYTGALSVYAARGGAAEIVMVDSSKEALSLAQRHFEANGFSFSARYRCMHGNVFDILPRLIEEQKTYDCVVCDPPAFAKSLESVARAKTAYLSANRQCCMLLREGGILVTSSCSGRLTLDDFSGIIRAAAFQAGRDLHIIDVLGHPYDHTDRLSFAEGRYLKTLIARAVGGNVSSRRFASV
ncbi:MAG: class I SAM-dependent rRNA methyltransferase [Candidatus Omnitrophica bacterium]|nr:class I SAM-dependent rRNA methyltransferase [Candidatus Omnitrophota bacterium]